VAVSLAAWAYCAKVRSVCPTSECAVNQPEPANATHRPGIGARDGSAHVKSDEFKITPRSTDPDPEARTYCWQGGNVPTGKIDFGTRIG